MEDKAQNNWKQLLDDTEGFPGEGLMDKNASWEKLYARLHKKPKRRLVSWYWAAACFIAIAIAGIMYINMGERPAYSAAMSSPVMDKMPIENKKLLVNTEKKGASIIAEKNLTAAITRKNILGKEAKAVDNTNMQTSASDEPVAEASIPPMPGKDSSMKEVIAVAPGPKKLRVIHINDLSQPIGGPVVDHPVHQRDKFSLSLLNSESYHPVSTSYTANGLPFFKSKNASN